MEQTYPRNKEDRQTNHGDDPRYSYRGPSDPLPADPHDPKRGKDYDEQGSRGISDFGLHEVTEVANPQSVHGYGIDDKSSEKTP